MKIFLSSFILFLIFFTALPSTGRRIKISPAKASVQRNDIDTIIPGSDRIIYVVGDSLAPSFSGYDKKIRSTVESFFAVNNSDRPLRGIDILLNYTTMDGTLLHTRRIRQRTDIAPHSRIKIDIRSWDRQKSFYYYQSDKPRNGGSPYKVTITPEAYYLAR